MKKTLTAQLKEIKSGGELKIKLSKKTEERNKEIQSIRSTCSRINSMSLPEVNLHTYVEEKEIVIKNSQDKETISSKLLDIPKGGSKIFEPEDYNKMHSIASSLNSAGEKFEVKKVTVVTRNKK